MSARDGQDAQGWQRTKALGRFLAAGAQGAQDAVASTVHSAHDRLTEYRHERRCRKDALRSADIPDRESWTVLLVEPLVAVDLREEKLLQSLATCDAYCTGAVGSAGDTWDAKREYGQDVTQVVPRQRNPWWSSVLRLPIPPGRSELTVRVMDSKTIGSDQLLGKVCIDLTQQPSGAGCFRLLGGGFGSLCLRWGQENAGGCPKGSAAFEQAVGFWAAQQAAGMSMAEAGEAVMAVLAASSSGGDGRVANELLLQAPLAALLRADLQGATAFLGALAGPYLELLSPSVKARLAGVLLERSSGGLPSYSSSSSNPKALSALLQLEEQLLHRLLCSTHGDELLELTRLIDTNGSSLDLLHLVTKGLNDTLASSVIAHIHEEVQHISRRPLHVISDIDMTVCIGRFGSGGPKFPHGRVPGALPVLRALDCQITFLTARPQVYEWQTRRELLGKLGIADAALLPGDLSTVVTSLFWKEDSKREMCEKKSDNFCDFATVHPEAQFIFLGDSGEGDVAFAESFTTGAAERARLAAGDDLPASSGIDSRSRVAFIHDVVDETGLEAKTSAARRQELLQSKVIVFDTYAGVAASMFGLGIFGAEQLYTAAQGCHDEFEALDPVAFMNDAVYFVRRRELLKDLEVVNSMLLEAQADPVDVRIDLPEVPWWRL